MKKYFSMKKMISVLCALVLVVTAVFEPSWFGKANENVDEVSAADVAVPTGLTEIGWKDFGDFDYKEYVAPNPSDPSTGAVGTYSGNSLNGTLFNDNVIMGYDVDIRFAGHGGGWTGLMIRTLTDGTLRVENSTFDTPYEKTYQPADYGLTSFIGDEFNLKISTQISGTSYTFGIWVNNKILGDYFTLEEAGGEAGTTIGFYCRDNRKNITLLPATIEVPTDYMRLQWKDFKSLAYQEYEKPNPDVAPNPRGTYSYDLNKTLLNGNVTMSAGTQIRYAGTTNSGKHGWYGLVVEAKADGTLSVTNGTFTTQYTEIYQPEIFGLDHFYDRDFNLKISVETEGDNYTFCIWINDRNIDKKFTLTGGEGISGSGLGLYDPTQSGTVTLKAAQVDISMNYKEIDWTDFKQADGTSLAYDTFYPAQTGALAAKGTYYGDDTNTTSDDLNKTIFNDNIVMGAGTQIRYAGNDGWQGLIIRESANNLVVENSTFGTTYSKTYYPDDYDLTSFAGDEFNLKISTVINEDSYTFGIWVNNKILDDYFTLSIGDCGVGAVIGLYDNGSGNGFTLKDVPVEIPTTFTAINWESFGLGYQEYTTTATSILLGSGTYSGNLNKTLFSDNVIMGNRTDIRYAGKDGWNGLRLDFAKDSNDSYIYLDSNGFGTVISGKKHLTGYKASELGIDALVDKSINLKISTEISGNIYRFGVWINDVMIGGYITIEATSTITGTMVGLRAYAEPLENVTLIKAGSEPPKDFTTLIWTDFTGLAYQEYPDATPALSGSGTYAGSLHQTLLNDRVILGVGTEIRYGGSGWNGIGLHTDGDKLYIHDHWNDQEYKATFDDPSAYELTSFANDEFNLKISTEINGTEYTFGVWINDKLLGYYTLDAGANGGKTVGLYGRSSGNPVILEKQPIALPTDFTTLGWNDFTGLICKEYEKPYPDVVEGYTQARGTYAGNIHQTLLNGNIVFEEGTELKYDGNGWNALGIRVYKDRITLINHWNDQEIASFTGANSYGLSQFTNEEINLKISTEVDSNDETIRTYGIWINDQILGKYYEITAKTADANDAAAPSILSLYENGSGNNIRLVGEQVPTNYTILTPLTSFGIAAGSYTAADGVASVDTPPIVEIPNNKLDKVIFQFHKITYDGNVDLGWGGENVWVGFRLRSDATAGTLTLQSGYTGASGFNQLISTPITMTDAVAGVDLVGGTYNLKISMEYTDETIIKMGIWFDNILYNNEYVLVDLSQMTHASGDAIGLHLGVVSQNGGGTITFGEEEITLPNFYWNLADGIYTLPSTATDAEGNSIAQLDKTGDHYITYTFDGKILERNVFVWEIGDVKVDDDVNSKDLVRTKKLASGLGGDTDEAGKEAADFDKDNDVDETDVYKMQRLLLGDVFEYGLTLSEKMLGEGNEDVMPIVGYYGPASSWSIEGADGNSYTSKDTVTDAIYKLISEVGINIVTASNDAYTDANKAEIEEQLTLAQKYGLSMFVKDGRIHGSLEHSHEELQYYLDGYGDYEAFAGMFIVDEPRSSTYPNGYTSATFDDWAGIGKKVNQYGNLSGYVNLNPYYEGLSTTSTKTEGYQAYLTEYIKKFAPQYLSFDYYLFSQIESSWFGLVKEPKDVDDCEEYLQNLVMVRNAAKNNDIPFWSFVQAGSNWNDDIELMSATTNNTPSEGQFKWQANIALAFGAKGITYFPLIQPHYFALTKGGTLDYKRNGLIAEDGSINSWFGYAQQVNKQIAAVDEILMNATNKGVIPVGTYAKNNITSSLNNLGDTNLVISNYGKLSSVSTTGTTYGAVVGCFDYNGKTALYVVNYDVNTARDITLTFSESVTADVTISGSATEKSGSSMTLSLGAGEGALVVLE